MDLAEATLDGAFLFLWIAEFPVIGQAEFGISDEPLRIEQIPDEDAFTALLESPDAPLPTDEERRSLTPNMRANRLVLLPTARALQFLNLSPMFFQGDRVWFYWQTDVAVLVEGDPSKPPIWRKTVVAVEKNGSVVYTLVDRKGQIHVTTDENAVPCDLEIPLKGRIEEQKPSPTALF